MTRPLSRLTHGGVTLVQASEHRVLVTFPDGRKEVVLAHLSKDTAEWIVRTAKEALEVTA